MIAQNPKNDPIYVVALGITSGIGSGIPKFWSALVQGTCGIGAFDLFDTSEYRTHIAAQVKDIPFNEIGPKRSRNRLSRCDLLALAACEEAVQQIHLLDRVAPHRIGISMGAGAGGMLSAEHFRAQDLRTGKANPNFLLPFPCGSTADWIAHTFGVTGPRSTVVTACSSSATSIGLGMDWIRSGLIDVAITGGSDALSQLTYAGFNALRSVDTEPCKPFDLNRKGLSFGEGAAILVLANERFVVGNALEPFARLMGYAVGCDAYHMTAPDTTGNGAIRTITSALKQAGVQPEEVQHVNTHGTATKFNDLIESKALTTVFGERCKDIPVTALKSLFGHCLGAAGCMEAVSTVLSIYHNLIPPTAHYETPDPECPLTIVHGKALSQNISVAISNSFAFGGNNSVLVFAKAKEE